MNKTFLMISCLSLLFISACQNTPNKPKEEPITLEVQVERSENSSKATITTKKMKNGQVSEEIQIFEGTHEEVMNKVALLTDKNGNDSPEKEIELKMVKKIQFQLNPKSGSETECSVTLTEEY